MSRTSLCQRVVLVGLVVFAVGAASENGATESSGSDGLEINHHSDSSSSSSTAASNGDAAEAPAPSHDATHYPGIPQHLPEGEQPHQAHQQQEADKHHSASISISHGTDHHDQRSAFVHSAALRVYVADLPEKYTTDLVSRWAGHKGKGECDTFDTSFWGASFSSPMGERVAGGPFEMRYTNQFDLDMHMYTELLKSPLRMHSFEEADIVFVPGVFMRLNRWCYPEEHRAIVQQFLEEYPAFLPNVTAKPHVIGYPRTGWDNYKVFEDDPRSLPFTWTTIEAINSPTYEEVNKRMVPLPYPAHYHWSRGSGHYFKPFDAEEALRFKTLFVSETFVTRLEVRRQLKAHCMARAERCTHAEFQEYTPDSHEWDATGVLQMYNLTHQSWYCFQPPGDTFTRRAFWDCLVAGAIPVVFEESYFNFHQFSEYIDWRSLLVYIPREALEADNGTNVVDLLEKQHTQEGAVKRLEALHAVRHALQYSLNPLHELVRFDLLHRVHPEDDALTLGLRAVLANLCGRELLPEERCRTPYRHQQSEEQQKQASQQQEQASQQQEQASQQQQHRHMHRTRRLADGAEDVAADAAAAVGGSNQRMAATGDGAQAMGVPPRGSRADVR